MAKKEDEKDKDSDNGERFVRKQIQYYPERKGGRRISKVDKEKGKQEQDKSKK